MTTEQRESIDRLSHLLEKGKYGIAGKTLLYEDYYMLKNVLEVVENQERKIIRQLEENKKKDKQIDLMAKFIENNMSEKKIINEICIKSKCNNEECHEDDLKDCIKQYFANKVNSKIQ